MRPLRHMMWGLLLAGTLALVAACSSGSPASTSGSFTSPSSQGSSAEAFFKGKTITIMSGQTAGTRLDLYARLVAQYLPKHLPGVSSVVVQDVKGSGGAVARSTLQAAKPDGLTLALINVPGAIDAQVKGSSQFSVDKASWIGRVSDEEAVLYVGKKSGIKTLADLQNAKKTVPFAITSMGGDDYMTLAALRDAFHLPIELVTGFTTDSAAIDVAVRGEVTGTLSPALTMLPLYQGGHVTPLMLLSNTKDPHFPSTPLAMTLAKTAQQKAVVGALVDAAQGDRSLAGPPGMSPDRLAVLRQAFTATAHDPAFLAAAVKLNCPVTYMSGAQLTAVIQQTMAHDTELSKILAGSP